MDAQVRGFEWDNGLSDRVALYADDVLVFLSDPEMSGREHFRYFVFLDWPWVYS